VFSIGSKMLETQIVQQASYSSTPSDRLPSKHKPNLMEQCNAMILTEVKELEGPKRGVNNVSLHNKHDELVENDKNDVSTPSKDVIVDVHNSKEVPKDFKITSPKTLYSAFAISLKRWLRLNLTCHLESF